MGMQTFRNIWTVTKRELKAYFSSVVAYAVIFFFLLLMGVFTFLFGGLFDRDQASLDAFFMWHPWLYLFLVPAVGMGVWSEERRMGTIELLLTMPISAWQAIIGKFLASWIFIGLALVCTTPVWYTVNYLGDPDNGVIFGTYIGSFLMAGAYLSISCMASAMSRSQVVSFIVSVVICFGLLIVGWTPVTDFVSTLGEAGPAVADFVANFSFMPHFENFQRGLLVSNDVIYFLSLIGFPVFATGVILRGLRAG